MEPIPGDGASRSILFSAQPKGYNITTVGTKAAETFDPDVFENTIYNAYFMLFDGSGILRVLDNATVSNGATVSYSIKETILDIFPNAKVCFLANVPSTSISSFTVDETTWDEIDNFYLSVNYAASTTTKCIGVPESADLNGDGVEEHALPMFGSSNSNSSFTLERLLAKVEIHVSLGIERELLSTSMPQFGLDLCTIHNIPKFIPLTSKSKTKYSTIDSENDANNHLITDSYSTYNLNFDGNKMLYKTSGEKSFYFYTPEHMLGNVGTNQSASEKPILVENDSKKRPIFASVSGFLVDGNGASYEAKYNIYFGGNAKDNFDLIRNKIYKNYIGINGATKGPDVDHRVEILDKLDEIVDDVSKEGQCANCYIIGSTGTYMLPAYRGAYNNLASAEMCDVGEDVVLASDNPNITITIDHEKSKQSTIIFNVTNKSDLLSGNAVIARLNSQGQVDWSWHLWFIPGLEWDSSSVSDLGSTIRIGGLSTKKMYDGTTMADRNLGVNASLYDLNTWMPGTIPGTYYKYGYRNPYFQDQLNGTNSDYHGFNEDDYAVWNSVEKAVTDPCPPGYRVPPIYVWEGNNAKNVTGEYYSGMFGINVYAFRYWDNGTSLTSLDDLYYPCTQSGNESSVTHLDFILKDISENGNQTTFDTWEEGRGLSKVSYQSIGYDRTTYSNLHYKVPVESINQGGEMVTQSPTKIFQFRSGSTTKSNIENSSVFVSCTKTVHRVSVTQKKSLTTNYLWKDVEGTNSTQMISSDVIYVEPSMTTNWREKAADERLPDLINLGSKEITGCNTTTDLNSNTGYQLRCIKE